MLLIPGLLLALIAAHMLLLVYHKHTQWPGPGRTEQNVVGYPMLPVYAAKAGGFFFIVFGVTALMGGLLSINPVWKYGPYDPSKVTAGSQPDWYMGWPDGALRIMPGSGDAHLGPHDLAGTSSCRSSCCPCVMFTILLLLPFIEAWITGDKREHHLLQRPRNAPTRTAVMVALMTFYGLLWAAGGNDIIAIKLHLSINQITYFMRAAVFIGPVDRVLHHPALVHLAAAPRQRDAAARLRDRHHHALARGRLHRAAPADQRRPAPTRSPPATATRSTTLGVGRPTPTASPAPGTRGRSRLRAKLSTLMYADNMQKPTARGARGGAPPRRARARAPGRPRPPGRRPRVRRPPPRRARSTSARTDRRTDTPNPPGARASRRQPTRRLFARDADPSLFTPRRRPVAVHASDVDPSLHALGRPSPASASRASDRAIPVAAVPDVCRAEDVDVDEAVVLVRQPASARRRRARAARGRATRAVVLRGVAQALDSQVEVEAAVAALARDTGASDAAASSSPCQRSAGCSRRATAIARRPAVPARGAVDTRGSP